MRWAACAAVAASLGCGRWGFRPQTDDGGNNGLPDGRTMGWFDDSYPQRYRVVVTNSLAVDLIGQPLFLPASMFAGGPGPIRESAIRVVGLAGTTNFEIPFAIHDWDATNADLDDADGDLDANDELMILVDVPASGTAEYHVYYDTTDHTPAAWPTHTMARQGTGFSRVAIDGTVGDAAALAFRDGAQLFSLALTDSIPLYNNSSYTYDSSRVGPRIDDLTLPDGTPVYKTVTHTGPPTGPLTHTVRLGPIKLDGSFQNTGGDNAFYQPHLVAGIAHSAVRVRSRPVAAVVVIDAELYCTNGTTCTGGKDAGDVRIIGYLFDRPARNEVVTLWRVTAAMDGATTIASTPMGDGEENYALAGYLIEEYTEATFPSLIDIDTMSMSDGTMTNTITFVANKSQADRRATLANAKFAAMTDSEAPYTGAMAMLPFGPLSAFYWDDGAPMPVFDELNGYQSQWGIYSPGFDTWGQPTDSVAYQFVVLGYPRPTGDVLAPAAAAAAAFASSPALAITYEARP